MTMDPVFEISDGVWASQCLEALELSAAGEDLTDEHKAALARAVRICERVGDYLSSNHTGGYTSIHPERQGDAHIATTLLLSSYVRAQDLLDSCQGAIDGTPVPSEWLSYLGRIFEHVRDWAGKTWQHPNLSNSGA